MGFAAADFIELALAAVFLLFALVWRPWLEPYAQRFAHHTFWCMTLLAALPVALRLALLAHHPVPVPDIYDEFGHLFVADTLRHFRLANPPHPLPQFFETFFILQQPTYSSIYPIGQGLALAIGWTLFGTPWAGVLITVAALCSLCYWMLRGWTTPGWALVGGMLAVFEFGPLSQWTNSYWGGAFSAAAGCLVFGALPRLRSRYRTRDALLLGLGLAMHLLSRPYESIFLVLAVILFALPDWRRPVVILKPAAIAALVVFPAIGITLLQNKRITGSWTTLPYTLSQEQYGVPAALTFQPQVVPHRALTREQELDFQMQKAFRASETETLSSYLQRLWYRLRYYRFYFYAPLYVALAAFVLFGIRSYRYLWVALTVVLFALGVNFFPAFQFHYMAAVVCLFILMSVRGLELLSRWPIASDLIVLLCVFQFGFGYATQTLDQRNPEGRIEAAREIANIPGDILIFVRYWPQHKFQQEWVYNAADIDSSRVVWARDLGEPENAKLREYFPHRGEWLLEPDARPPRLSPYRPEPPPEPAKPDIKRPAQTAPKLQFEQVR